MPVNFKIKSFGIFRKSKMRYFSRNVFNSSNLVHKLQEMYNFSYLTLIIIKDTF
jgi:hypothetical protein